MDFCPTVLWTFRCSFACSFYKITTRKANHRGLCCSEKPCRVAGWAFHQGHFTKDLARFTPIKYTFYCMDSFGFNRTLVCFIGLKNWQVHGAFERRFGLTYRSFCLAMSDKDCRHLQAEPLLVSAFTLSSVSSNIKKVFQLKFPHLACVQCWGCLIFSQ